MSNEPVDDLLRFIDASPSPHHAVDEARRRLDAAGFRSLSEADAWELSAGDKVYVIRGGASIAAFVLGTKPPSDVGFRLVGAHSDSPNLRVKPNPLRTEGGCVRLGVETYGGVLWHTWLDRDLSIAGRVSVRDGEATRSHLLRFEGPLLRIPSLAIHLNRGVNKEGLKLNAQKHLPPLMALVEKEKLDFRALLRDELSRGGVEVDAADVLGWDLCCFDVQPSSVGGLNAEFLFAPRLDNLASCHAGLSALLRLDGGGARTAGVVLYDHEEVGSRSAQGAASSFMRSCLKRISQARSPEDEAALERAIARSFMLSADMAHAVHPNHSDRHDSAHQPILGDGPVIKINANQAYATDGEGWASFERWCADVSVKPQRFIVRTDLPCGGTIGPITAAELGLRVVDVGSPMLSMHSCREMAATADVAPMIDVMERFFIAPS